MGVIDVLTENYSDLIDQPVFCAFLDPREFQKLDHGVEADRKQQP